MTAWVEVLPGADLSGLNRIPILRMPMQTDTSLTCWGWFHSQEFRFGAHNFHSLNLKKVEASDSAGFPLQHDLTHEVLVSKSRTFTFYRNGQKVISMPTPRAVIDCDSDVVLLGSTSIALSFVTFCKCMSLSLFLCLCFFFLPPFCLYLCLWFVSFSVLVCVSVCVFVCVSPSTFWSLSASIFCVFFCVCVCKRVCVCLCIRTCMGTHSITMICEKMGKGESVCVSLSACSCVCHDVPVSVHTCVLISIYSDTYTHTHTFVRMHIHKYIHMYVCMYTCIHTYVHSQRCLRFPVTSQ